LFGSWDWDRPRVLKPIVAKKRNAAEAMNVFLVIRHSFF